jgi:hypothetical protein
MPWPPNVFFPSSDTPCRNPEEANGFPRAIPLGRRFATHGPFVRDARVTGLHLDFTTPLPRPPLFGP